MQQTNNSSPPARAKQPTSPEDEARAADCRRRMKAAGLDKDEVPDDMDEVRNQMARRINMFVNEWEGCPEALCRRNRGCMAPNIDCTNARDVTMTEEEWDNARADIYKAVQARVAELGDEDD